MVDILDIFRRSGALLEGHFKLTSGLHSRNYFQCAKVLQYPEYNELLAQLIADHFAGSEIDVVIAPAVGGIVTGQEVGRQLGKRTIFAERQDGAMTLRRGFAVAPGEKVLVCEDVVTTGGSVREVVELMKQSGAVVVGVGFIVDRSGGKVDFGCKQFSAFAMEVETFQPGICPMCAEGLPVEKPGSRPESKK
jgi:orotate phosphoribosyltransferase